MSFCLVFINKVSIPKWYDLKGYLKKFLTDIKKGFNSKMVRFKENRQLLQSKRDSVSIPKWYDLKEKFVQPTLRAFLCFNSKMVRFKVVDKFTPETRKIMFQFQNGTI